MAGPIPAVGIVEALSLPGIGEGVDSEHPDYLGMKNELELVDDLRQGTKRFRERHDRYLPQFAEEKATNYQRRWQQSTLYNAFEETIGMLVGKAFSKPPVLDADVPEVIRGTEDTYDNEGNITKQGLGGLAENIDRAGNHFIVFVEAFFKEGLRSGVNHILVDMTTMPVDENGAPTVKTAADVKSAGLRPYWIHIKAQQIIGWKSEVISGEHVLTQVRIRESVEEPDGGFATQKVDQIRVLDIGAFRIFRKPAQGGEWEIYKEGPMKDSKGAPLTFIPLVTFYTDEDNGFMTAIPPFIDLAYKNVEHYQVHSDYRNCMTVACFPIFCISGYQKQNEDDNITVGPTTVIILGDPQAKAYFAEHSGKALGAAREYLNDLKEEMSTYGLKLLMPKKSGQTPTATEEAIGEAKTFSQLQVAVLRLKDCLERALDYTARWLGLGEDSGGSVVVSTTNMMLSLTDIESILKACGAPSKVLLDRETGIRELMRRGFLDEDTDPAEVVALLEADQRASSSLSQLAGTFLKPPTPKAPAGVPPVPPVTP